MDEPEITQDDVEALTAAEEKETPNTQDTKMSFAGIVNALKKAVADGNLTPQQAAGMRRDMGISSGFFTKKRLSSSKRKSKNKAARAARKVTRRNRKG